MLEENPQFVNNQQPALGDVLQPINADPEQYKKIVGLTDGLVQMALQERPLPGWDAKYTVPEDGGLDVEYTHSGRGAPAHSLHIHRGGKGRESTFEIDLKDYRNNPSTEGKDVVSQHIVIDGNKIMGSAEQTRTSVMFGEKIPAPIESGHKITPTSAMDLEQSLEGLIDLKNEPIQLTKKHWWQRKR